MQLYVSHLADKSAKYTDKTPEDWEPHIVDNILFSTQVESKISVLTGRYNMSSDWVDNDPIVFYLSPGLPFVLRFGNGRMLKDIEVLNIDDHRGNVHISLL